MERIYGEIVRQRKHQYVTPAINNKGVIIIQVELESPIKRLKTNRPVPDQIHGEVLKMCLLLTFKATLKKHECN